MDHDDDQAPKLFEGWCVLELYGHRRLGGHVTEQEIAGKGFLRIDVPGEGDEPVATQFYASGAIFSITPTTEPMARAVAAHNRPAPVQRWELPQGDPVPVANAAPDDDEHDEWADEVDDDLEDDDQPWAGV